MLYQKGTQRIEVIVKKEGGSAGVKTVDASQAGGAKKTTWRTSLFGSESPDRMRRVLMTNATHTIAFAKQAVNLAASYKVAGIGYETGDQALQEQVGRQVEIVRDFGNAASGLAMGAVYGAWGGPLGMMTGMILSGAYSAVSLGFKYKSREREFDYKVFKENNSIEYQRARANINLTTGRLR